MEVASFEEIADEFVARAHRMVWCSVATIDQHNRPRSRILHPIWEGHTGWIATRPTSPKVAHLRHNPFVSLAYIADVAKPLYVDCRAAWVDDLAEKQRVWDLFKFAPAPVGYDPANVWQSPAAPDFGVLKLMPWRIHLYSFPEPSKVWRQAR